MASHIRRLLAVACLLPLAAQAAAPTAARELPALKVAAIELGRDLHVAERAARFPNGTQASFHVAVGVGGFLLESFTVQLDGQAPQTHTYSSAEALALLKNDGWHRLARLSLAPGRYRLHAQFSGRFHDARPNEQPVTGFVDATFEKGAGELDLVLPIARSQHRATESTAQVARVNGLRFTRAAYLLMPERIELARGATAAGGPDDPRYRNAVFLKDQYRFFSALIELGEVQRASRADALPASFWLLMAECELGFGMDAQAAARYERLAAGDHDSVTLTRAQLQLAQFEYQQGRAEAAIERLKAVRERVPAALRKDWQELMVNALLALDRHADAIALVNDAGAATPVLRYNLGVALVRSGKAEEGRAQLEQVGTMPVTHLEQLAFRDKANLALGYQHLQQQRGAAARAAFGRVRTQGPFSNRALLGLGWAEVARTPDPAGADPTLADDDSLGSLLRGVGAAPAGRLDIEGAATAPSSLPAAEQQQLRRALVTWVELVKRDPMDPAVQEGLLAIPWALDRLQAHSQSLTRYLQAIEALEAARTRMGEAIVSIRRGALVKDLLQDEPDSERGWLWKVRTLRNRPETYFLQSLLAEHRFQETLKQFRDARMLGARLESWRPRVEALDAGAAESLRTRLNALRPRFGALAAQDEVLRDLSLRELEGQRATIEQYLTEARFAVARIYDRQSAATP
jgi:tetratricopeptide (TPR) repeat protein